MLTSLTGTKFRNSKINKHRLFARSKVVLFNIVTAVVIVWPFGVDAFEIETPAVGLVSVPMEISVSDVPAGTTVEMTVDEQPYSATSSDQGIAAFSDILISSRGIAAIQVTAAEQTATLELRMLPGWVSLLPPLVAIAIALLLRSVIPALVVGIWLGATALTAFSPAGIAIGLLDSFQVFVTGALANADHAAIILFSMMIGGMVGIITRNGGMTSIVQMIVSRAKSAIGGQVAVWLMGLMIFFDDYSNTLVVGNTARPITDHLKISREKLAYIVDSTAAPVVCIALITTWIGYEVGLIGDAMKAIPGLANEQAYTVFLHSIPYSFYPILAVVFVLAIASTGLDMGPMYAAELRAREGQVIPSKGEDLPAMEGESLDPKPNIPLRAVNAFVPLLVLIGSLLAGLYVTGEGETITEIAGSANAYKAMMWASFAGAITAGLMTIAQGILSAHETIDAWYGGVRAMLFAMIVLVLAWSLSDVTAALNTAGYLVTILADTLPVALVPAAVFILSAITAFTTGTSWGTMGILMPLVIPLTWAVMSVNGMTSVADMHLLYSAVACNLAGAVWGDHCSPISDTTVLSSMASGCDHIEHVRTQMPYALLVGVVGLFIGTIPGGFGVPPWVSIIVGIAILFLILRVFGRSADKAARHST